MPYSATPLPEGTVFMGYPMGLGCTASHSLYAQRIKPINDKVVMVSIGASVQNQISSRLETRITELTNPKFKFVNLCQVSKSTEDWLNDSTVWDTVATRMESAGILYSEVQILWLQNDSLGNTSTDFPARPLAVKTDLISLLDKIKLNFPNLKHVFVSGRPYSGYSVDTTFTEPKGYYHGFSCKWMVEDQINGLLPIKPWICDLAYLWTSADTPRADGLHMLETDWKPNDVHLSSAGKIKLGDWLFDFFKTNSVSLKYFY